MAEIYYLDAHRKSGLSENLWMTRNQRILAAIQARFAARTPEQVRTAKLNATEEELQAVQRRYARLLEAKHQLLTPGEIAADPDGLEPAGEERGGEHEQRHER
jgi:hypothetical protein